MKVFYILMFVLGAILAGTANLQLTAGVILLTLGYVEFRKMGLSLDQIDDVMLAKLKQLLK